MAYLDEVAERGVSLIITKRGRPVAKLRPAKRVRKVVAKKRVKPKGWGSSKGALAGKAEIVGDIINTSDLWTHFGETAEP